MGEMKKPNQIIMQNMKNTLGKAAALIAAATWLGATAQAATLTVTSTDDSGAGTLRDALANAADSDTIDATGVSGAITLTTGQLSVTNSVTILGPGANILAVNGNYPNTTNRVFYISPSLTVTIAGLSVTNGLADSGGGIMNDHSALTVSNCVISRNGAEWSGGGIYNNGVVTFYNDGNDILSSSWVTIVNSTISLNGAAYGGGLDNQGLGIGGGAEARILNSTFSGNSAESGGGIRNNRSGSGLALLTVLNSTFSDNHSIRSDVLDSYYGYNVGDGILMWQDGNGTATLDIGGTIMNRSGIVTLGGTITSLGYNLTSDDGQTAIYGPFVFGGTGFLTSTGDQTNTNPMLGPLQLNGGQTPTHALLCGSPAIDAGTNFTGAATDQRGGGFSRPFQFGNATPAGGDGTDIGAYEVQMPAADLALSMGATKTSAKGQTMLTYTITVTNSGPGTASNVVVSDPVPSGTLFSSASANKGSLTTPAIGGTGMVTWSVGNLLNGTSGAGQINVTVIVKGKTPITNTATVTSDACEVNTANNTATVSVPIKGK
jgi:uncharacterized repeat protein (TIGR01451 family)